MEMADPLKLANPPVYHQALCEGNLLLRSQVCWDSMEIC